MTCFPDEVNWNNKEFTKEMLDYLRAVYCVHPMVLDALDYINSLESRIAELEAERRWRIIANGEMPEDRAKVLVAFTEYTEQIDILTAKYYKHYEGFGGLDNWWNIEGWHTGNVTHWMPLPQPPEVQE